MPSKSAISAVAQVRALHHWPDAPARRGYLAHPHAHQFKIIATMPVSHDDRQVEFHDFEEQLWTTVNDLLAIGITQPPVRLPTFGSRSCEAIARAIMGRMPLVERVEVWEDDGVGATVEAPKNVHTIISGSASGPTVVGVTAGSGGSGGPGGIGIGGAPQRLEGVRRREEAWERRSGAEQLHEIPTPAYVSGITPEPKDAQVFAEIVTICGSTRFKAETMHVIEAFQKKGLLVLAVEFFHHADGHGLTEELKSRLDDLHFAKIRAANKVFIVNPGGYIGESTRREIGFAQMLGKPIEYMVDPE